MNSQCICLVANNDTALRLMLSLIDELEKERPIDTYLLICERCYWVSTKSNVICINMEKEGYRSNNSEIDLTKPFGKKQKTWLAQFIQCVYALKKMKIVKETAKKYMQNTTLEQ